MVTYANAVEAAAGERRTSAEIAYLKAVARNSSSRAAAQAAAAAAAKAAAAARPDARRGHAGAAPAPAAPARRFRCHEHEHGRLGLHPSARVRRQLLRRQRRRIPVPIRHLDRADGVALAGTRTTRRRCRTRPRSSSTPSAAGSPGRPATSAGCEDRTIDEPRHRRGPELRTHTEHQHRRAVHNRPHTLRRPARTDDAFLLAVRGANAMAGARPHRAEPGARRRAPDEGRCRADPHCTHDGSGRHCCCCSSCTHVAVQQRPRLGPGDPPPGGRARTREPTRTRRCASTTR